MEYFNTHKLRLTFILGAAIIFIIREILIALFKHELKPEYLHAFSAFLFVLGAIRVAAILTYQQERKMALHETAVKHDNRSG